jgi:hypothetical protein
VVGQDRASLLFTHEPCRLNGQQLAFALSPSYLPLAIPIRRVCCRPGSPPAPPSTLPPSAACRPPHRPRDKQPWEASDGAVYLLRELSPLLPSAVPEFLPAVADLARLATFQHAYNLHETIWRALPDIARALGAKEFKRHLEQFIPPAFADLKCGHQLSEVAAGKCIAALRDLIGPRIFAGRLDDAQRAALASDANIPPPPPGGLAAAAAAGGGFGGGGGAAAAARGGAGAVPGVGGPTLAPWLQRPPQAVPGQPQR